MNLKDWLRPIIWNSKHSHTYFGFFICGFLGILLPHPIPLVGTLVFSVLREGMQQLSWPWKHEFQTFDQMLMDTMEFTGGGALAAILDATLRHYIR